MGNLTNTLRHKIYESQFNNFGIDNYDESRFGKYQKVISKTNFQTKVKLFFKKLIRYNKLGNFVIKSWDKYLTKLEIIYSKLSDKDRKLLVELLAYRALGFKKVKLSTNSKIKLKLIKDIKKLKSSEETYDPHFMNLILERFNLNQIGYNIDFFFSPEGIVTDFILEQYAYKINSGLFIEAEKGDIVFDLGGCWGDTALYFAEKIGKNGKVYSFEFIPNNMKIHKINTDLNPHFKNQIELVPYPVSDISGNTIYFKDRGPSSVIEIEPFYGYNGKTTTITIDDFVRDNNIEKVDFIKMDIEGAELFALNGALETIKKFKPKLAIAIYHSMEDFVNIPIWILDLKLDYDIYINHYTIHAEETICFAKPRN